MFGDKVSALLLPTPKSFTPAQPAGVDRWPQRCLAHTLPSQSLGCTPQPPPGIVNRSARPLPVISRAAETIAGCTDEMDTPSPACFGRHG